MKLAELFYSVQGEGVLLGMPSVFIRTTGCNLRCSWCDTPYTSWTPEGRDYSIDDIISYVIRHSKGYTVVTGGEPMLAPELTELTGRLKAAGQHITIETAGTIDKPAACDLMSISPKLANSTPGDPQWAQVHDRLRIQPQVLRRLTRDYDYQLKFVVSAEKDVQEIDALVASLAADRSRVLLMPEGTERDELNQRGMWLAEIAKREGYRFAPRLHVELYGHQRGT
jgi:7-carboxy-7-deazaguanine synthase